MRTGIGQLETFLAEVSRVAQQPDMASQLVALSQIYYKVNDREWSGLNPFEQAYKDRVINLYKKITKHSHYDPSLMEKTDAAGTGDGAFCPLPYRFANSRLVGEFLSCYGWILHNLDVISGADVLEYGAGEGQLAIHLARMGCNMHAIDIEQRFLDLIKKQCDELGICITLKQGQFGDGIGAKQFDRIIFFEAFHHCLDHFDALMRIRTQLKPDGFLCFAGEPIIRSGSADSSLVPYPWGLRMDGEAMRSIAEFGWMELGYSEPYFIELLSRSGYSVERSPSPFYSRGDVYIARRIDSRYPLERNTLISTYSGKSGWHPTEGTHRWTDGDAWFPLPVSATDLCTVTVSLKNMSPRSVEVEITGPLASRELRLSSNEDARLTFNMSPEGRYLRIQSNTFRPDSADSRVLGVAVTSFEFH